MWAALAAVTVGAGLLRLLSLGPVPQDPFYDAAVRSMSLSWHNFFFGAFDPSGATAIDKPPLDLWLQVASVKVFGFTRTALKLPQALAGTAAVPLLFLALRRVWGTTAALISALVLAVLPISVLTARSDTMDAVMMALTVLALALVIRASLSGRVVFLYLAGAAIGLAFNIKLLEALIPVPALAVLAWLGLPGSRRKRVVHIAGAGVAVVAVSLSWLLATLAFPASERPFAIGSTNGSAWNAAFVFNGYDRIAKPARTDSTSGSSSGPGNDVVSGTGTGHDAQLDRLPIRSPSPTRLFSPAGPLSGRRLGFVLAVALLLGIPGLIALARAGPDRAEAEPRSRAPGRGGAGPDAPPPDPPLAPDTRPASDTPTLTGPAPDGDGAAAGAGPARSRRPPGPRHNQAARPEPAVARARRATAIALLLWLVGGAVLFSAMARLHARYVEAFDPAVAAAAGAGLVWAWRSGRLPRLLLAATLGALAAYVWYLKGGTTAVGFVTAGAAVAAAAAAFVPRVGRTPAALVLALVAVVALPVTVAVAIVHDHASDAGLAGYMAPAELDHLSSYLRAHRHGARYEVAVSSATQAGSLIVKDAQPVLILTTYDGRTIVGLSRLQALARSGAVRYALLGGSCHPGNRLTLALCSAPARWIHAHGQDVSRAAGLTRRALLWRLPTR